MYFADALTLDAPRRTADGYLAVTAKAARTGVYQYTGAEVDPTNAHGLRDQAVVNVLRDENTVFDKRAAHSFIGKPITDDHPKTGVNASNWRDHARGVVMGAMRDGDHLAFDLLLTDAATIAKVDAGKAELSNGYQSALEFGSFTAADGTTCQARQTSISGNHVALVDRGRAGPTCRIGDAALCDSLPTNLFDKLTTQEKPVKNYVLDGLTVDLANVDTAIATVDALKAQRDAATTKLTEATTAHDKALAAKDTEIDKIKAQVVDQAKIDALADAKAEAVAKGKAVLADKMPDTKGKSVADVRRMVVAAKLGDAAIADKSDDYVEARFDGLTADTATSRHTAPSGTPMVANDTKTVRDLAFASRY